MATLVSTKVIRNNIYDSNCKIMQQKQLLGTVFIDISVSLSDAKATNLNNQPRFISDLIVLADKAIALAKLIAKQRREIATLSSMIDDSLEMSTEDYLQTFQKYNSDIMANEIQLEQIQEKYSNVSNTMNSTNM
jgi:hypothetical protein